ncbi:hypothetical protein [Flagellimonas okinawensis]|uniref:Uncharacterized protein n=1 Tax=Flagellimonas okinawensis TaxID=3031324 RepID=A0ABT5XPL3_9FLAO|nr:hypothetical protein [[Muricauda] okinawensis]MDF0707841.1 hypothetical protein [[Muricauda] okinawensis]
MGEQNMELYNGPIFRERLSTASTTHPFFLQSDFTEADFVFDGQPYFGQNVKYHVHLDELLATPKYRPTGLLVRLVKNKVEEFTIEGHRFIKLDVNIEGAEQYGYVEVLESSGENLLLKKYTKKRVETRKESQVVIEYEDTVDYILLYQGVLEDANSRGNWNSIFTEKKKDLRSFFKENRIAYRTDKDTFFKLLFNKLVNSVQI